ncbi:hypothetical protein Daus18300_008591 [Diaporthe australafricana]|uniref:Uncharacterized protein n=1 Tax=Diaporthe australafricana TaxID=127596 RepID=A0ABR3WI43_9PEZI
MRLNALLLSVAAAAAALAAPLDLTLPTDRLASELTLPNNPLPFNGWYADPEIRQYDSIFWIFPTTSIAFEDQKWFSAFSSPDLINWTPYDGILAAWNFGWARDSLWAPASIRGTDGRYYLYFSANGLRSQDATAGLGVGVSNQPEGPYMDALGTRLVDSIVNGANPMDPDVFVDDDGVTYFYFGGSAVNVALLNDDMISFRPFPDTNTTFKDITPSPSFVEGTKVFKRNGIYYMMWSENGYGDPTYQVAYGMSSSPLGLFTRRAVILWENPNIAVATGHNGILNLPGTDEWYIVYHRRPLNETDPNHRQIAIDRLYFGENGEVQTVIVT